MKIKVAEATRIQLNWLVAKCEGVTVEIHTADMILERRLRVITAVEAATLPLPEPYLVIPGVGNAEYSSNWAQGGPISERERIDSKWTGEEWIAGKLISWITSQTELDAKMRCYVISRLGEEAEIPDCLA